MSTTHRVLVPFELPDAEPVPPALVDRLARMEVVVVGRYGLPEQTPSGAGRDQFEAEARAELDGLVADFERAGTTVTSRLVFGGDRRTVVDDIALAEECDAVLVPGEADAVDRVLVALRDDRNVDRILGFVGELLGTEDASVTLLHSAGGDRERGETLLAAAADRLVESGVDRDRIDRRLSDGREPTADIVEAGNGFDLIVLGETEPSLMERILGAVPARIVRETDRPALVVRGSGSGTGGEK